MCGIAGALTVRGEPGLENIVGNMADAIYLRGPDDSGVWTDAQSRVGLGHRRLSILDLSPAGHQPMLSVCSRFVLVFNGEVYNHQELRDELQRSGCAPTWRGHSDTETLLAAICAWGLEATLVRTRGMFALALWDRHSESLKLARDRLGEKPLYYGWVANGLVFGSELKALRAFPGFKNPISRDALNLFLRCGTVPAPYSIYSDVWKVDPGCVLTVPLNALHTRQASVAAYWSIKDVVRRGIANPFVNEQEALASLEDALSDAVAIQSLADVPVGAFLSGGVDSSTIVALMQAQAARPVQTFTIGFEEQGFDESAHARAVARHLGTDHHELPVSAEDARAVIPSLPTIYDEPFADSSQIPTHIVCKVARARVTVALSGDGGDELFGGYNRYFWSDRIWNRVSWLPSGVRTRIGAAISSVSPDTWDDLSAFVPVLRRIPRVGDKAHKLAHRLAAVRGPDDLYRSLVTEWPPQALLVRGAKPLATRLADTGLVSEIASEQQRMMLWDTVTYLPDDILTKVDRAAMSVSLETRVPFLDPTVVEAAWRLPLHMKIRQGKGKWALRQILYKYVPRSLIDRPKAGFGIPVGAWLRGPLRPWAEELLSKQRLDAEGFLNADPVRRTWEQHLTGRFDWSSRLWAVLMFQAWLEVNH